MQQTAARPGARIPPGPRAIGLVAMVAMVVVAMVVVVIGTLVHAFPSSPSASVRDVPREDHGGTASPPSGPVTEADGVLPRDVTVFDDQYPGIANLDPDLLRALRAAANEAAHGGIELVVNSGWRSVAYQDALRREALSEYGSEAGA